MKKATIADLAPAADYGRLMEAAAAYVRVERPKLSTPEAVYNFLAPFLGVAPDQEKFIIIYLNTKNRPIDAPQIVTTGLLDMSPVHPREVFRGAIVAGAAGIILAHNHPSGDPTPSREDYAVTKRLIDAGMIVGIRVLDHIILGTPTATYAGYRSMRDDGVDFKC